MQISRRDFLVSAVGLAVIAGGCRTVTDRAMLKSLDPARRINMDLEEIAENVYHLQFETQYDITSTLLRPQEYFESPEFKGRIFTLEEFKIWYTANSPNGQKTGEFTYYTDWNGFNFPSHVLDPFYDGAFNPLSDKERQFLNLFEERKNKPFYFIGTHREKPLDLKGDLKHELGHALFYASPAYRLEVLGVLEGMNKDHRREVVNYLASTGGYHPDVFVDETHAHLLASLEKLKEKGGLDISKFTEVHRKLNELFDRHFKSK